MDKIEQLLAAIQGKLDETVNGSDGKPITILEAFKMFPELQENFADLKKRLEAMETMAKERKWANIPGVEHGTGKNQFSLCRAMFAIQTNDWKDAGYEKEVFQATSLKAMGYSADTLGGYLVPAQAIPELIEFLRAVPICMKLGATVIPDLMGSPVLMPKQTAGATIAWVGENITVTPSDLAFGQVQLTPKKAMALAQVSNSLIRMALPAAEGVITNDLGLQLALAVDIAALRGPGAANQPLGIANSPNIGTYALGGVNDGVLLQNLDFKDDMEYVLAAANALRGKLGFAFNPIVRRNLKKIKVPQFTGDAGVQPLVEWFAALAIGGAGFMSDAALEAALGYPFEVTTQIPTNLVSGSYSNCTEIYFGNWAELLIGIWAGLRIMVSDVAGTAFASDQTWLRIIMEVDTALRHDQSFCYCSNVRAS
jgi:HK97 family phage major capsid protein